MPVRTIDVTVTAQQDYALQKIAARLRVTPEQLLQSAATEQAKALLAQFERELLNSVPQVWSKATPQEKAQMVAQFEEIAAR